MKEDRVLIYDKHLLNQVNKVNVLILFISFFYEQKYTVNLDKTKAIKTWEKKQYFIFMFCVSCFPFHDIFSISPDGISNENSIDLISLGTFLHENIKYFQHRNNILLRFNIELRGLLFYVI